MSADVQREQILQELRAAISRICDEILEELDRGRREQDERIADFIKYGEIRAPWRHMAIFRFITETALKVIGGTLLDVDQAFIDYKAPSEYKEEEANRPPKPLTAEAREMLDEVLANKPGQDEINRKIGENVKTLRDQLAADDECLLACYRSLLKARYSEQEKDLGILEEVLRESGVEPAFTLEQATFWKMSDFDFKLKRKIKWRLAIAKFQQLLHDEESNVHLC